MRQGLRSLPLLVCVHPRSRGGPGAHPPKPPAATIVDGQRLETTTQITTLGAPWRMVKLDDNLMTQDHHLRGL